MKLAIILPAEYGIFTLKINCGSQQHTYQVSTMLRDATESKLHPELFHKIVDKFGKPSIDLFESRINSLVKACALASRIKGYGS